MASTTTDAAGLWLFNSLRQNLKPATALRLSIGTAQLALATLQPTRANANASMADFVDSDAVLRADQTAATWSFSTPNWGVDDLTLDSGWLPRFHIGNFVWADLDGDGVQGAGEPGIGDVTVRLLDLNGTLVASESTDTQGYYDFDSMVNQLLPNKDYVLVIDRTEVSAPHVSVVVVTHVLQTALSGLKETLPFNDAAAVDSNGVRTSNPVAGFNSSTDLIIAPVTTPFYGTNNDTLDFGFVQRISIGDTVFLDLGEEREHNNKKKTKKKAPTHKLLSQIATVVMTWASQALAM